MADGTKIEWTDATWNPITGCSVVSPGCTNCYAMKLAGTRLNSHPSRAGLTKDSKAGPVWTGEVRFNPQWLDEPLRWKKPRMIFVCAHGDLFAEGVPDEWIDQIFAVMALAPQHTFQVLTKRPDRMRQYLTRPAGDGRQDIRNHLAWEVTAQVMNTWAPNWKSEGVDDGKHRSRGIAAFTKWPLPNVWLGVSVEDQKRADVRIPILLDTPAAIRWISAEPLLGPINIVDAMWAGDGPADSNLSATLDWVVAGGESGVDARPMHPDWARSLRDQCATAGVPFLFKQWGAFAPKRIMLTEFWNPATARIGELIANPGGTLDQYPSDTGNVIAMRNVGKKAAGRLLDGIEHNGFPEIRR